MLMKAYKAEFLGEDWCTLIHGETEGRAKANFLRWNPMTSEREVFTEIRLTRLPELDDLPITYETATAAGFEYEYDEDTYNPPIDPEALFTNDCQCRICKEHEDKNKC